ncbi:hypothetical protein BB561_004987 [Smittium simulii]|uniref:RNI-like protein n=1 Tax=Smittium simulii TaxID=133385 RepID=A0A2T9YCX6_9FUNG|nr:hypothetical protein BB561_004987 [Smittium simulii]
MPPSVLPQNWPPRVLQLLALNLQSKADLLEFSLVHPNWFFFGINSLWIYPSFTSIDSLSSFLTLISQKKGFLQLTQGYDLTLNSHLLDYPSIPKQLSRKCSFVRNSLLSYKHNNLNSAKSFLSSSIFSDPQILVNLIRATKTINNISFYGFNIIDHHLSSLALFATTITHLHIIGLRDHSYHALVSLLSSFTSLRSLKLKLGSGAPRQLWKTLENRSMLFTSLELWIDNSTLELAPMLLKCNSLTNLKIKGCNIRLGPSTISRLVCNNPNLQTLFVQALDITVLDLSPILCNAKQLTSLQLINDSPLTGPSKSHAFMPRVVALKLNHLLIVGLDVPSKTFNTLFSILKNLQTLSISYSPQLNDDSIISLSESNHSLLGLSISCCPDISDSIVGFLAINHSKSLLSLNLEDIIIQNPDLFKHNLQKLVSIEDLCVSGDVANILEIKHPKVKSKNNFQNHQTFNLLNSDNFNKNLAPKYDSNTHISNNLPVALKKSSLHDSNNHLVALKTSPFHDSNNHHVALKTSPFHDSNGTSSFIATQEYKNLKTLSSNFHNHQKNTMHRLDDHSSFSNTDYINNNNDSRNAAINDPQYLSKLDRFCNNNIDQEYRKRTISRDVNLTNTDNEYRKRTISQDLHLTNTDNEYRKRTISQDLHLTNTDNNNEAQVNNSFYAVSDQIDSHRNYKSPKLLNGFKTKVLEPLEWKSADEFQNMLLSTVKKTNDPTFNLNNDNSYLGEEETIQLGYSNTYENKNQHFTAPKHNQKNLSKNFDRVKPKNKFLSSNDYMQSIAESAEEQESLKFNFSQKNFFEKLNNSESNPQVLDEAEDTDVISGSYNGYAPKAHNKVHNNSFDGLKFSQQKNTTTEYNQLGGMIARDNHSQNDFSFHNDYRINNRFSHQNTIPNPYGSLSQIMAEYGTETKINSTKSLLGLQPISETNTNGTKSLLGLQPIKEKPPINRKPVKLQLSSKEILDNVPKTQPNIPISKSEDNKEYTNIVSNLNNNNDLKNADKQVVNTNSIIQQTDHINQNSPLPAKLNLPENISSKKTEKKAILDLSIETVLNGRQVLKIYEVGSNFYLLFFHF